MAFTPNVQGSRVIGSLSGITSISSVILSASTYIGLPTDIRVTGATYSNNAFTYRNNTGGTFNVLFNTVTGLTVNGDLNVTGLTNFTSGLSATTISACTSIQTNKIVSCSGDTQINLTSGQTIFNTTLIPNLDGMIDVGSTSKRFRDINTVSGTSTVWTSSIKVNTPTLDLGNDYQGNLRQITADNSIIQNDTLLGGTY